MTFSKEPDFEAAVVHELRQRGGITGELEANRF